MILLNTSDIYNLIILPPTGITEQMIKDNHDESGKQRIKNAAHAYICYKMICNHDRRGMHNKAE